MTITEDGKTKKLLLNKPLTVKTDKDGRIIVFSADGTDIPAPKDGTISIRIAGHDLKFIEEDKLLKLEEGEPLTISEDDGKFLWVEKAGNGKHGHKVSSGKPGAGEPHPGWTIAKATGDPLWLVSEKERELLDKVVAIREQAEAVKAKKLEFAELENSLKKLEEELRAKEEKIRTLTKTLEKGRGDLDDRRGDGSRRGCQNRHPHPGQGGRPRTPDRDLSAQGRKRRGRPDREKRAGRTRGL